MTWTPTISNCDSYLGARTGKYEWRRVRYQAALRAIQTVSGLHDDMTIMDIGAGWTEFDYCLRVDGNWKGRYIPIDGGIDGTNLDDWLPPREVDWIVGLEIIEHLYRPVTLLKNLKHYAKHGII